MSDPLRSTVEPPAGPHAALDALCAELGVQPGYEAGGKEHRAPPAAVRRALRELGAPLADGESPAADAEALREVRQRRWRRMLEPVTVAWTGTSPEVSIRVEAPAGLPPTIELHLESEDGAVTEHSVSPDDVRWVEEASVEGSLFRRGVVVLEADLPEGHHHMAVEAAGRADRTRLIRAPRTAFDGDPEDRWRRWGAFLPLWALRTERDRGVGDVGDLAALARWTAERGGAVVGTLPMMAAFLGGGSPGEPVEPSPYAPVSRLFWNELYLDLEALPGLAASPAAREALGSRDLARRSAALRDVRHADPVEAMAVKRRVIEALVGELDAAGLREALDAWAVRRPEALRYARFRAYGEAAGEPWRDWPARARRGELEADEPPRARVDYHLYAQWAFEEQLDALARGGGAGLYLDLPLGCHADGFDTWRYRDTFAAGFTGGAPPDALARGGQDWGFPPLHPHRSRDRGHAYLTAALRCLMRVSDTIRVDHVMSLHRLFWVPSGGEPADGVYVLYPAEELWATLCLESRRHRCEVVGEDLGTVPAEVPEAMERHLVRHTWVLPFEQAPPGPRALAALNTHDMPPFATWWREHAAEEGEHAAGEEDPLAAAGTARPEGAPGVPPAQSAGAESPADAGAPPTRDSRPAEASGAAGPRPAEAAGAPRPRPAEPPVAEALERLAGSPARLVLVNLEDLWHETEPQNVPGTSGAGNWTRRARLTLGEMREDPRVDVALERVERARAAAERAAPGPSAAPAGTDDAPAGTDDADDHPSNPEAPWST